MNKRVNSYPEARAQSGCLRPSNPLRAASWLHQTVYYVSLCSPSTLVPKMPPKLAAKSQVKELIGENSNKKGSRAVAQTMSSSKFGLSGSNMQINIRLGPNRSAVLPKSSLGFSNSKSESSLCNPSANHHCINSFKNDIPDRPSTAR